MESDLKAESEHSGKSKKQEQSSKRNTNTRWIVSILLTTFFLSAGLTFLSAEALAGAGYLVAFLVLAFFILIGILFDVLGVAVTSASEAPFHSMASHKERGGAEAIRLLKNAEKVASICNDVVGDISGIVSGSSAAIIVTRLSTDLSLDNVILQLLISGLVAGITIGGKALGKTFAINKSTKIVHFAARLISYKNGLFAGFRRKKKRK